MTTIVQKGQYIIRKGDQVIAKRDAKHKADEDLMNAPPGTYMLETPLFEYKVSGAVVPPAPQPPAPQPPPPPPPEPPSASLGRITYRNKSSTTQPPVVTDTTGFSFEQGAIPTGKFPQFAMGAKPCAATMYGHTYWPDGSLQWVGALLRLPDGVGTEAYVDVKPNGSAQTNGARALVEAKVENLSIEITGVDGLDGTWTARLDDAIDTGRITVEGNGPAGLYARVLGDFRNAAGQAHGQLMCEHFVQLLTDAAGGLQGMRHMARIGQPFADVAGDTTYPQPRFRDVTGVLKRGSSVVRKLRGHRDATTVGDVFRVPHNGWVAACGVDARYDYYQCGGSSATDHTLQTVHDIAYWQRTRVVAPYRRDTQTTNPAAIDYLPFGFGTINYAMGSTGEREDIGVDPEWVVRHLIRQSAETERVMRVNAMCLMHCRWSFRDRTTGEITPAADVKPSYPGLGPVRTSWRTLPSNTLGYRVASPNTSYWGEDGSHPPAAANMAYLLTGEVQFREVVKDVASARILEMHPGTTIYKTGANVRDTMQLGYGGRTIQVGAGGPIFKGAGVLNHEEGGLRTPAWCFRDLVFASQFAGGASADYFKEVVQSAYSAFKTLWEAYPGGKDGLLAYMGGVSNSSPWMTGMELMSACYWSQIAPSAGANYVRAHIARYFETAATKGNIAAFMQYRQNFWNGNRFGESIEDCTGHCAGPSISFSAATGRGTIQTLGFNSPNLSFTDAFLWTLSNGDAFSVSEQEYPNTVPWAGVAQGQVVYAVNVSGTTFQAALTPGGAPLAVPSDITLSNFFARPKNMAPSPKYRGYSYYYPGLVGGASYYAMACGEPMPNAKLQIDAILAAHLPDEAYKNAGKYRFSSDVTKTMGV